MRHRHLGRLLSVAALCFGGLLAGTAPAAWASCAPTPPASPVVFTGTVISTERSDVVAHVRTDTGRRVTVIGSPSDTGVTTVDRIYEVGARYEFHPLNATNPFRDNICTRTHLIAPVSAPTPCPARTVDYRMTRRITLFGPMTSMRESLTVSPNVKACTARPRGRHAPR